MPRIFVPNEPLRRADDGELVRFLPLGSLPNFGEVVELTPKGSPGANPATWMDQIRKGLETWEDGDFLVLVGDQALLAYAAFIIGQMILAKIVTSTGVIPPVLRFLKWERRLGEYAPIVLREYEETTKS